MSLTGSEEEESDKEEHVAIIITEHQENSLSGKENQPSSETFDDLQQTSTNDKNNIEVDGEELMYMSSEESDSNEEEEKEEHIPDVETILEDSHSIVECTENEEENNASVMNELEECVHEEKVVEEEKEQNMNENTEECQNNECIVDKEEDISEFVQADDDGNIDFDDFHCACDEENNEENENEQQMEDKEIEQHLDTNEKEIDLFGDKEEECDSESDVKIEKGSMDVFNETLELEVRNELEGEEKEMGENTNEEQHQDIEIVSDKEEECNSESDVQTENIDINDAENEIENEQDLNANTDQENKIIADKTEDEECDSDSEALFPEEDVNMDELHGAFDIEENEIEIEEDDKEQTLNMDTKEYQENECISDKQEEEEINSEYINDESIEKENIDEDVSFDVEKNEMEEHLDTNHKENECIGSKEEEEENMNEVNDAFDIEWGDFTSTVEDMTVDTTTNVSNEYEDNEGTEMNEVNNDDWQETWESTFVAAEVNDSISDKQTIEEIEKHELSTSKSETEQKSSDITSTKEMDDEWADFKSGVEHTDDIKDDNEQKQIESAAQSTIHVNSNRTLLFKIIEHKTMDVKLVNISNILLSNVYQVSDSTVNTHMNDELYYEYYDTSNANTNDILPVNTMPLSIKASKIKDFYWDGSITETKLYQAIKVPKPRPRRALNENAIGSSGEALANNTNNSGSLEGKSMTVVTKKRKMRPETKSKPIESSTDKKTQSANDIFEFLFGSSVPDVGVNAVSNAIAVTPDVKNINHKNQDLLLPFPVENLQSTYTSARSKNVLDQEIRKLKASKEIVKIIDSLPDLTFFLNVST